MNTLYAFSDIAHMMGDPQWHGSERGAGGKASGQIGGAKRRQTRKFTETASLTGPWIITNEGTHVRRIISYVSWVRECLTGFHPAFLVKTRKV
jgi:hypothetical protein